MSLVKCLNSRINHEAARIDAGNKKGECIMGILNFIIAIVALIIAIIAFQRTGGIKDLKKNTAELLARVEKKMREENPDVEEEKTR